MKTLRNSLLISFCIAVVVVLLAAVNLRPPEVLRGFLQLAPLSRRSVTFWIIPS